MEMLLIIGLAQIVLIVLPDSLPFLQSPQQVQEHIIVIQRMQATLVLRLVHKLLSPCTRIVKLAPARLSSTPTLELSRFTDLRTGSKLALLHNPLVVLLFTVLEIILNFYRDMKELLVPRSLLKALFQIVPLVSAVKVRMDLLLRIR